MFKILKYLQTNSPLIKFQKLNNNIIALYTSSKEIKFYSADGCAKEIYYQHLDLGISCIAFSLDSKLIAFSEKNIIHIIHTRSEQHIQTIKLDDEIIDKLEFDLESRYIIISTASAKLYQYRYNKSYPITREWIAPVSYMVFYKQNIAIGCENGSLFVRNLYSRVNNIVIHNGNSPINSISYVDDTKILTGDSKGDIYLNSFDKKKYIKKIETRFTKVTQINLIPKSNYMIVAGDSNYISLYDIKKFKLICSKYIEFDDIVKNIEVVDRYIILVTLQNSSIKRVELYNPKELDSLIVNNSLDAAFKLAEQGFILKETDEYKRVESAYDTIYDKATQLLVNGNIDKALEITNQFREIKSKKQDIETLFKAFQHYPRFKILTKEKNYLIAYSMSNKFPALQKTIEYKEMENRFKLAFKHAQQMILSRDYEKAKTVLSEFIIVTQKRDIIKLMLDNNEIFIEFLRAIESDDFQKIYKIVKTDVTFLKIHDYKIVEKKIELILKKIQNDIKVGDIESAYKRIDKLKDIDYIDSKISKLIDDCQKVKKLKDAYERDDFISCYELLDKHFSLNNTELAFFLHKHWKKIIYKCEDFALNGDLEELKNTLGELISLGTRREMIGNLFRICFYVQIDSFKNKKDYKQSETLIYLYIDIFGLDDEIITIMGEYEFDSKTKLAFTQNQNKKVDRDSWIYSEVIMGNLLHHRDDSVGCIIKLIN